MNHVTPTGSSAEEAIALLKAESVRFRELLTNPGDVSPERRMQGAEYGQTPYAIVVACSDSRAIPEAAFPSA